MATRTFLLPAPSPSNEAASQLLLAIETILETFPAVLTSMVIQTQLFSMYAALMKYVDLPNPDTRNSNPNTDPQSQQPQKQHKSGSHVALARCRALCASCCGVRRTARPLG